MSKKTTVPNVPAIILGKEFTKETKESKGRDGTIFPAHDDQFWIYVVTGDKSPKYDLFNTEPRLIKAQVTKQDWIKVRGAINVHCTIQQNYDRYSILSIDGMTVLGVKNDSDFDEDDFDEDIESEFGDNDPNPVKDKKSKKGGEN